MRYLTPRLVAAVAACVLLAIPARTADLPAPHFDPVLDADPFAAEALLAHPQSGLSPAVRAYLQEISAASRLDLAGAERHLQTALSAPGTNPQIAMRALSVASGAALRDGQYARAADWLDREISNYRAIMTPQRLTSEEQGRAVAMALRDQPAQTIEKQASGTILLSSHALGFTTGTAVIEGHAQTVVLDTGTSISAMSATAAKALGVHMLGQRASASSATRTIETSVAMADTVSLGPVILHHVIFLVVDDAVLAPAGPKYQIDVIIGLQVFMALGRVTFHDDKPGATPAQHSLILAPSKRSAQAGNLRFDGFSPLVRVTAGGDVLTFFVDGGARKSNFHKRYGREFADRIAKLEHKTTTTTGAGGAEERQSAIFPSIDFKIGSEAVTLHDLSVDLTGSGPDDVYGSVGMDVLWGKGGYTFDFGTLNLSLGGD